MPRHSEATLTAIKNAVDIVSLVGDYGLPLERSGSKYKALCPFHDDHKPSMELNPDRQSYKCWVCGAGGDVFDFVKEYDRVEFPEALKILADRAGIALDAPAEGASTPSGASKSELLAVNAWAEGLFADAMGRSSAAKDYLSARGILGESAARFRIGYAPGERGWLLSRAKAQKLDVGLLERAGLVSRPADAPGVVRERFRGRLMFPIHDPRGRTVGFGGRVLPEVERLLAASGKHVAKYVNSSETAVFQKRRFLYGADLARPAAREAGWVAVVEGYTDVIAAHQVGLGNVVGTLGTALGDDHVVALRRLADRAVLVFDGDAAGQKAADRALELFLGHEVDVRVLSLPDELDPCDFLLNQGADAFRSLVATAVDPLAFALKRAGDRFDLGSIEGARLASEWVLAILARVPSVSRVGLDVKVAKALDTLSGRLGVPVDGLKRRLGQLRCEAKAAPRHPRPEPPRASAVAADPPFAVFRKDGDGAVADRPAEADAPAGPPENSRPASAPPIRVSALDPTDRELLQLVLNEPGLVGRLLTRVTPDALRDAPLRAILRVCYDLHAEGEVPTFGRVSLRLDEGLRALAAGLLLPIDSSPLPDDVKPPPWADRLGPALARLAERDRQARLRDLKNAQDETNQTDDPGAHRALKMEYLRLLTQRPDTKKSNAS